MNSGHVQDCLRTSEQQHGHMRQKELHRWGAEGGRRPSRVEDVVDDGNDSADRSRENELTWQIAAQAPSTSHPSRS